MKEIDLFVKILVFVKEGGILILRSASASSSHLKIVKSDCLRALFSIQKNRFEKKKS